MLTLEQVQEGLNSRKINIEHVARTTGLSRMTIVRMKRGDTNPSTKSYAAVSNYLEGAYDED